MDYRRYGDTVIVRLDKDEEICRELLAVAEKEQIRTASVSGIGAVSAFTVGLFDPEKKQFGENRFTGYYEVTALNGNLSTRNGEPYLHLHMSCADAEGHLVGGHLARATISLTAEIFLHEADGCVERSFDAETGLNTFAF